MTSGGVTAGDAVALDAARARVSAVLDQAARVQMDVLVIAPPNAARIQASDRARALAATAGRSDLLDEASDAARERVTRSFAAAGYTGTWAVTDMAVSVARGSDRVAIAAALEEAVAAAVVEDLADAETLGILTASWAELVDYRTMSTPGSLSNVGSAISSARGMRGAVAIVVVVIAGVVGLSGGVALGTGLLAVGIALGWRALSGPRTADPGD